MPDVTVDEILRMTAGRELDALIAETFFGWRWMKYQAPNASVPRLLTGLFPPAAPGRLCVANRYDRIWLPSDRRAERFSGWDNAPWWESDGLGGHERRSGFAYYSTKMDDASLVIQALDEHLWRRFELYLCLTPEDICKAALLSSLSSPKAG